MGRPLGQHFLFQPSILERIVAAACPPGTETCIEIGPGPGGLTEHLLPRCKRLIAVELDAQLAANLRTRYASESKFELVEANVLDTDLSGWGPAVVCGNLPYYITSPIIEKTLQLGPSLLRGVFLVQKEVADRLGAAPGSRDYGYLSVATQVYCEVQRLFIVKPASFRPPPKVDSAVVRLSPRPELPVPDPHDFLKFASKCFQFKRKTLRNNVREVPEPYASKRAEQLSVAELAKIYEMLR